MASTQRPCCALESKRAIHLFACFCFDKQKLNDDLASSVSAAIGGGDLLARPVETGIAGVTLFHIRLTSTTRRNAELSLEPIVVVSTTKIDQQSNCRKSEQHEQMFLAHLHLVYG